MPSAAAQKRADAAQKKAVSLQKKAESKKKRAERKARSLATKDPEKAEQAAAVAAAVETTCASIGGQKMTSLEARQLAPETLATRPVSWPLMNGVETSRLQASV